MEDRYRNDVAVQVPRVLLPKKGTDYYKWAVVACDQFTSQPSYWEDAKRIVGKAPSTLELILPEAYLEKPGEEERIASIKSHMRDYLDKGVLEEKPQGFVLVTRTVGGATRTGLVMMPSPLLRRRRYRPMSRQECGLYPTGYALWRRQNFHCRCPWQIHRN